MGGYVTSEKWPPRFEFEATVPAGLHSRWPRVNRNPRERKPARLWVILLALEVAPENVSREG
jgi:hypothetical protein